MYSAILQSKSLNIPYISIDGHTQTILMSYQEVITINPNIRFGKPCIVGTRISVYDVLGWLAAGMNNEEILEDFPQLKKEHILACLAYSADKERRVKVAA